MTIDLSTIDGIYVACGRTDMRKSIDGLAAIVESQFRMNPFERNLFLFCGRKHDRIKMLLWDETGFLLLYKRLEKGRFQWPDSPSDVRQLSHKQLGWLLDGLSVDQKGLLCPVHPERMT